MMPAVSAPKDLGITITPEQAFDFHINHIIKSALLTVGINFKCFV